MLTLERDIMNYKDYPASYSCPCGENAFLKLKDVKTTYKNKTFLIRNVPGYECENDHFKLARITRVKIKKVLKTAWEQNQEEIDFS